MHRSPARINTQSRALRSTAVEYLTGKRLGKRCRLLLAFKIDPTDIGARNLPETNGLEFHMIEPRSHLTQLLGQVSSADSYFDYVKHARSSASASSFCAICCSSTAISGACSAIRRSSITAILKKTCVSCTRR